MNINFKNIYTNLLKELQSGNLCTLATVISTTGSTPQKPGSSAIIDINGLVAGTVGGGSVEHRVIQKAVKFGKQKKSDYLKFSLNDDITTANSAICGGEMKILLDSDPHKNKVAFVELIDSLEKNSKGILLTKLTNSNGLTDIHRQWITDRKQVAVKNETDDIEKHIIEMLASNTGTDVKEFEGAEGQVVILEKITPLPKLIIAGAGHVGKALSHLAKLLDFEVTVYDDRPELANTKNLPDADYILCGQLEETVDRININSNTYIVLVTRGHSGDAAVLKKVINSGAGYIGMIGSKKKIVQVRQQFVENGWATEEQWKKIHAPIGLDIHSKTVEEIAVSIAAELIKERYKINNEYL